MINRKLILVAGLLPAAGCGPGPAAKPDAGGPGAWRVAAIRPGPGGPTAVAPGMLPPEEGVEVEGEPGYLRATVAVVQPNGPGRPDRPTLNDVLFPVGARTKVVAGVARSADTAAPPRVVVRVETAGETSESFVEPAVPFLAPGAATAAETLARLDQSLPGGEEVPVARWSVETPAGRSEVAIRVLFSRRPTGPRLKPEAKPPR